MASALRHPISHWSTLIEELQASPLECYAAIEEAIQRREIPGVRISRVWFKEGFFSAKRLYLRVSRNRLGFDICAAPFGTGFFFSWRFGKLRPSSYLGCTTLLLLSWAMEYWLDPLRKIQQVTEMPLVFPDIIVLRIIFLFLTLWVVGKAVRKGYRIFRPPTYYKLDTIDIFQKAVHAAVLEVVDDLARMRGKGLRALAPVPLPLGKAMLARLRPTLPIVKLSQQTSSSIADPPVRSSHPLTDGEGGGDPALQRGDREA